MEYPYCIIKTSSDSMQLVEYYRTEKAARQEYSRAIEKVYWGGIDIQNIELFKLISKFEKGETENADYP